MTCLSGMTAGHPLARRPALAVLAAGLLGARRAGAAGEPHYLRLATGSLTGTYYPIGELLGQLVSTPPGARVCDPDGVCGVPDLIVIVQTSKGSVENVAAIQSGAAESGFAQSDVAHAAFNGQGPFAGQPPLTRLRALASLYLESAHLVARRDSGIGSVADLRGRRVSVDVEGSGTLVEARLILDAFGLGGSDLGSDTLGADGPKAGAIEPVFASPGRALDLMAAGELDALFLVAGAPAAAVGELLGEQAATLVPIIGPEVDTLLRAHRFLVPDTIPAGTYPGQTEAVATLGVAALWLVAADLDADLVHAITAALWQPAARARLVTGHPKGEAIQLQHALRGVALPVHPGAARFYQEHGIGG